MFWSFLKALVRDLTEESETWTSFSRWWRVKNGCERDVFVSACQFNSVQFQGRLSV